MVMTETSRRFVPGIILLLVIAPALTCPALSAEPQKLIVIDDSGGSIGGTNSPVSAEISLTDAALVAAAKENKLVLSDRDGRPKRLLPTQFVPASAKAARGELMQKLSFAWV